MPKKPNPTLSEQLRAAIVSADKTRYQISKETGVTEASLSRFVNGLGGLSVDSVDKIGLCLGLRIVSEQNPRSTKKGK